MLYKPKDTEINKLLMAEKYYYGLINNLYHGLGITKIIEKFCRLWRGSWLVREKFAYIENPKLKKLTFIPMGEYLKTKIPHEHHVCATLSDVEIFRDVAPINSGLYLEGNSNVNPRLPYPESIKQSIKVGESTNMPSRIKEYRTHNPYPYFISFLDVDENNKGAESFLQRLMEEKNLTPVTNGNGQEFYDCPTDMYLEFSDQGFSFFLKWL